MSAICTILANFESLLKDINPSLCESSKILDVRVAKIQELSDEINTQQKPVSNLKQNNEVQDLLRKMQNLNLFREETISLARQFIISLDLEILKLNKKIGTIKSALSQKGYNKAGWNMLKKEFQTTNNDLIKAKDALNNISRNYEEGIEEFKNDISNDEKYITMLKSLSTVTNGIREGNYASRLPENLKATFPPIPGTGGKRTRRRKNKKNKRTRRSC
jgi:chromosome segregation ATPase